MQDWISPEELEKKTDLIHINCDTRDFDSFCTSVEKDWMKEYIPKPDELMKMKFKGNKFFFTLEEIIAYLKSFKEKTGGEQEWRFLQFKEKNGNLLGNDWSFKYMSFFKVHGGWICKLREGKCVSRDILDLEPVNSV